MNPIRTARVVVTAYVHVAHPRDSFVIEAFYHLPSVEAKEHVVVPRIAMRVHEDGRIGEVIVVVNDVAKIYLGFGSA